jgi:hypothetical protein
MIICDGLAILEATLDWCIHSAGVSTVLMGVPTVLMGVSTVLVYPQCWCIHSAGVSTVLLGVSTVLVYPQC